MANGRVRRQCGELRRFLGSKRRELKELIEHRAWQFVAEYVALWIPGSSVRRPELDRLRADAHRHQFDAVIVWKFDRFARSVSYLLRALEKFQARYRPRTRHPFAASAPTLLDWVGVFHDIFRQISLLPDPKWHILDTIEDARCPVLYSPAGVPFYTLLWKNFSGG